MLYDFFLGRLKREIESFGVERMEASVAELRRLRHELAEKCEIGTEVDEKGILQHPRIR